MTLLAVVTVGVTISTVVAMVIGAGIPALAAVITKATLPARFKVLVLLFLSTVTGVVSSVIAELPTTANGWWHLVLTVLMTYGTAAGADVAGWVPSGASAAISRRTARFGIGPAKPEAG